ncbi:MAG TPA: dihydrofolate reductase, partial [Candidatus Dormibacteraeota bacterium]|nr:dihydrofolate reductase [Candidatus Dormibacteraeota bacterium]
MRKIVNATYMTLDGDIQNMQDWHFEYFGAEATKAAADQISGTDALIMGRKTYDGFSAAWPE